MKKVYGVYVLITVAAVLFAYRLGAWHEGIGQQAARCIERALPEQDACLTALEANVERAQVALKALVAQQRE
ncbi:hypothetical protein [Pseudomonas sp.]|uniref:hypothetical protein n=1 Tax=Pseudomonas sp. TaxID=306 RepID=UPI0028A6592A|nr:hypothetical protein [Pseudomonas sp.]